MDDAFEKAVRTTLAYEGGYANDSHDPGGETNFGISKRQYPHLDIPNLTEAQARAIYRADYWEMARCHLLPAPVAVCYFDAVVNHGAFRAGVWLQKSSG